MVNIAFNYTLYGRVKQLIAQFKFSLFKQDKHKTQNNTYLLHVLLIYYNKTPFVVIRIYVLKFKQSEKTKLANSLYVKYVDEQFNFRQARNLGTLTLMRW